MAEINNQIVEDAGFDPNSWESLDETSIKNELQRLISKVENVTKLLEKMIFENDYSKTEKEYKNLWTTELGPSGFVGAFYAVNQTTFGQYKDENSAPPWYGNLSADSKKAFDTSHHYFLDASHLIKPMEEISRVMAKLPLVEAFRFMRITLNFDEAGYDRALYERIDSDIREVAQFISENWDNMERHAARSSRFYQDNVVKLSQSDLGRGYRLERIRDYQAMFESYKASRSFIPYSDGSYGLRSSVYADMRVIDKYTEQISALDNIEDGVKQAIETCPQINTILNNTVWKSVKTAHFLALTDALSKLLTGIIDFSEGALNVWNCYKNRDDDAPYCFIKKLPAYSSMKGNYGFTPPGGDPWHDGTSFLKLYEKAAEALSDHSYDFVYRHGHSNLP